MTEKQRVKYLVALAVLKSLERELAEAKREREHGRGHERKHGQQRSQAEHEQCSVSSDKSN